MHKFLVCLFHTISPSNNIASVTDKVDLKHVMCCTYGFCSQLKHSMWDQYSQLCDFKINSFIKMLVSIELRFDAVYF